MTTLISSSWSLFACLLVGYILTIKTKIWQPKNRRKKNAQTGLRVHNPELEGRQALRRRSIRIKNPPLPPEKKKRSRTRTKKPNPLRYSSVGGIRKLQRCSRSVTPSLARLGMPRQEHIKLSVSLRSINFNGGNGKTKTHPSVVP